MVDSMATKRIHYLLIFSSYKRCGVCNIHYYSALITWSISSTVNLWEFKVRSLFYLCNRACHPGGHYMHYYLGTLWYLSKPMQLIWRSGTCRLNLRVPDLQMSCKDLTTCQGTRIFAPAMAARQNILLPHSMQYDAMIDCVMCYNGNALHFGDSCSSKLYSLLIHWGWDKMAATLADNIFKCNFVNENV